MKKNYNKKIGFYVYSYYQAKEVVSTSINNKKFPYIVFKYYMVKNLGGDWIKEITKLLTRDFSKNKFGIIIECRKNPALALYYIRFGFSCIIFNGNNILQKKIKEINYKKKVIINPKIKIFDLKNVKNCNKYILKKFKQLEKRKK